MKFSARSSLGGGGSRDSHDGSLCYGLLQQRESKSSKLLHVRRLLVGNLNFKFWSCDGGLTPSADGGGSNILNNNSFTNQLELFAH